MLIWLLLMYFEPPITGDRPLPFVIREHIYMAEVYGRSEEGISALQRLWLEHQQERHSIARALAVIKGGAGRLQTGVTMDDMRNELNPEAQVRYLFPAVLIDHVWLEPGDWIDDYFVLDIVGDGLLLERRDGFKQTLSLKEPGVTTNVTLNNADARDILTFVARRQGLNAFVPSQIQKMVAGDFFVDDWLTFMDDICRQIGMIWIRRSGNVIFNLRGAAESYPQNEMIKSADRRNQSLNAFLQNIAVTFDLELMLDEGLEDVELDILLTQDQSWDEVLECLSLMNNFSWFVARNAGERSRLVIQKDREE